MNFTQNQSKTAKYLLALSAFLATSPVFAQALNDIDLVKPTAAAATNTDPAAKEALDRALLRYAGLQSYSARVESRSDRPNPKIQLVQYQAAQNLRLTTVDATGERQGEVIYQGNNQTTLQKVNDVWEYQTNTLPEVQDARVRLANINVGGGFISPFLVGLSPFREGARSKLDALTLGAPTTINGVQVDVVEAKLQKQPRSTVDTTVTFYVGRNDSLLHKVESVTKTADGQVYRTVDTISDIRVDTGLTDASFAFAAPQGATKVERFSRAAIRATVGQAPLPIETKDTEGKDFSLEQFKGKVVLIDFWATWCGPCRAELPNVKTNYDKYKDQGFDVVGISLDRSTDPIAPYTKQNDLQWRQVFDGYWDGPLATKYNVRAIPATILLGKDGKVAAIGARGAALEPAIKAALAQ